LPAAIRTKCSQTQSSALTTTNPQQICLGSMCWQTALQWTLRQQSTLPALLVNVCLTRALFTTGALTWAAHGPPLQTDYLTAQLSDTEEQLKALRGVEGTLKQVQAAKAEADRKLAAAVKENGGIQEDVTRLKRLVRALATPGPGNMSTQSLDWSCAALASWCFGTRVAAAEHRSRPHDGW
jgi:hypothetical protein